MANKEPRGSIALRSSRNERGSRRRIWRTAAAALSLAIGAGVACAVWFVVYTSTPQLLAEAKFAFNRQDFLLAESLALRLAQREEAAAEAWLIAGDSAVHQERFDDALEYYARVPQRDFTHRSTALVSSGDVMLQQRFLARAEDLYRQVLADDPANRAAHDRMAFVLAIQGREFEADAHRLALIRLGYVAANHLVLLATGERSAQNPELLSAFVRATPDDPQALCGLVKADLRENRREGAARRLARILRRDPNLLQAQAWKGSLLTTPGREDEFLAWNAALPPAAERFPETWCCRGDFAQAQGEPRVAIRCYGQAALLDANDLHAHYHLARLLAADGDEKTARPFLERASRLEEYAAAARSYSLSASLDAAASASELAEWLGLYWEAYGWSRLIQDQSAPSESVVQRCEHLLSEAKREPVERAAAAAQPARKFEFSSYPLPAWGNAVATNEARSRAEASPAAPIAFSHQAASLGIDFQFIAGGNNSSGGEYYYQHNGGGVAALDYDGDRWPDLHFTQGCLWPPRPRQREHLDRLYRNLAGGRFADVTESARLVENGFSQGVAAGDYDNDGFDDLFVCNIGANRLFHNNGDGTFSDVTAEAGVAGSSWSASCALADFNGDGNPDLYVVNYLTGVQIFEHPCQLPDGSPALCTPHAFPAAPDEFYLSLGDGRFAEESASAGLLAAGGKGLGVVAADLSGDGGLDLFVANDAVPNFYFENQTPRPGEPPRFAEKGFLTGLAVDDEGRSQACMGAAVADLEGDGRNDLFVTNFRDESNTLYVQTSPGQFLDQTRRAGLRAPSYSYVGFGAQFLDADLDGRSDLVLTNGHVGDLRAHDVPYHMPPQFFRNAGGGRFEELPANTLGPFFEGEYLGRGLARLDWNGDGLDDFAVSHLDSPAELVTNHTLRPGHYFALRLFGVQSSRDAVGAVVSLTAGRETWTAQLTAGDGYQSRNQRLLRFGIGHCVTIDRVDIHWPSGATTVLESPPVDQELAAIEDRR